MEIINLTKKEEEWIKELKRVLKKQPRSLTLFADGNLNVLKSEMEDCLRENGRMDRDSIVATILNACDGGVF
jgi:hypothetical protein